MTVYEAQSEQIWLLTLKVKNLKQKVADFESGERYVKLHDEFSRILAEANRDTERLRKEVAYAHKETAKVKGIWIRYAEELEAELKSRIEKLERENADLRQKLKDRTAECYRIGCELEEEKEKNKKLTAQINKDFENSSIPSSASMKHKKIPNSREKTGRKRGAQAGHPHHPRKRQEPTKTVAIPPDEKFLDEKRYRATGETVSRQMIGIRVEMDVTEYTTPVFIEIATGHRVHADFPDGVKDDVNYDGSIKAFLYMMNSVLNASIDGSSRFLSQLTEGRLNISVGMINGLNKKFAEKTRAEREECFKGLLSGPTMHADFTNAAMNGKPRQVLICSSDGIVMYFAKEHKGHKGIEDTPVEIYDGILINDHDVTWYSYGSAHQECLAHVLRALKGSIENEPGLKWNVQMRELLREMIHKRNSLPPGIEMDASEIESLEKRYDEILKTGQDEYDYEPPSDYYRDGYNLLKRLIEYREAHLLFLHDRDVESDNNEAERYARKFKRKLKQMMTFRSDENLIAYCEGRSIVETLLNRSGNLYRAIAEIF